MKYVSILNRGTVVHPVNDLIVFRENIISKSEAILMTEEIKHNLLGVRQRCDNESLKQESSIHAQLSEKKREKLIPLV